MSENHPASNKPPENSSDVIATSPTKNGLLLPAAILVFALAILILAAVIWFGKGDSSQTPNVAENATPQKLEAAPAPENKKVVTTNPKATYLSWNIGSYAAKDIQPAEVPKAVSWFSTLWGTPSKDDVTGFFEYHGFKVSDLKIVSIVNNEMEKTFVYAVYAVSNQAAYQVPVADLVADKDIQFLVSGVQFEQNLPAGKVWDTKRAVSIANPATKKIFLWQYTYDKKFKSIIVDRCYGGNNVLSESQLRASEQNYQRYADTLLASLDVINNLVKSSVDSKLASIPADPPEPQYASAKFGGSGSGEPTRTGVRALGGAASGAAIGGLAAGGDGAGYGAAAGFLGGVIYDVVSKANDSDKLKKEVAAENARRKANWLQEKKSLARQRDAVRQESLQYRQSLLTQYKSQITNAQQIVPFK